MKQQLDSLLTNTKHKVSILANATAFLYEFVPNINWIGFYLAEDEALHLGPFQGRSACVEIPFGKGACGRCAKEQQLIVLDDVTVVDNYIACHAETQSELVLPILVQGELFAVLDIDSLQKARFDEKLIQELQALAKVIEKHLEQAK